MRILFNKIKRTVCIVATVAVVPAYAQVAQVTKKLPEQQELGLRAPAGLKIDGKTTEWNNTFQAYNKATQVFYTMSNDDDNLYLSLQASNPTIASKILSGGVTLNINTTGKKKPGILITFPLVTPGSLQGMIGSMRSNFEKMQGMSPEAQKKFTDSLMYAQNRERIDKLKDLKITGVKEIPDSILSIYNEEGIKARALFDANSAYNYELAIPFKYLGISVTDAKEFIYNIKLNGPMAAMTANAVEVRGAPAGGGGGNVLNIGAGGMGGGRFMMGGPGGIDIMAMISPTDFWGKYIPVSK